ncbi:Hypothetical_protein [Hexamita inflata]|uniref:Hypothetical_protein n=1 Tax=Hexamita inflata TaxID=28002 RepID=A0AA86QH78_9EUKA|nr:Hypothetical protein HINF_LOCUS46969 [Hexamita inflata]
MEYQKQFILQQRTKEDIKAVKPKEITNPPLAINPEIRNLQKQLNYKSYFNYYKLQRKQNNLITNHQNKLNQNNMTLSFLVVIRQHYNGAVVSICAMSISIFQITLTFSTTLSYCLPCTSRPMIFSRDPRICTLASFLWDHLQNVYSWKYRAFRLILIIRVRRWKNQKQQQSQKLN